MANQPKRTRHDEDNTAELLHPPKLKTPRAHSAYGHRTSGSVSPNPPPAIYSGEFDISSIKLSIPDYEFGRVLPVLPERKTPAGFVFGRRYDALMYS